jgi:hypothetical protein
MINKKIEISVKKCDITNGLPQDVYACAIALAINRQFREASYVIVEDYAQVCFQQDNKDLIAGLPARVLNFINRFDSYNTGIDAAKTLKPFKFKATFKQCVL